MTGVGDALLGIGARHRPELMLLWAELSGLEAAERVHNGRGLPEPARALQAALWLFLASYARRGGSAGLPGRGRSVADERTGPG